MLGILKKNYSSSSDENMDGIKLLEKSKSLSEEVRPRNERVGWMKLHLGLYDVNAQVFREKE